MKNAPLQSNSSIKQNFTHLVYVIVEILLCFVALHKQILIVIFFPYFFPPSLPSFSLTSSVCPFSFLSPFFPYAPSQSKAWCSPLPLLSSSFILLHDPSKSGCGFPLPPCIKKEFPCIETCLNSTRLDGLAQLV